MSGFILRYTIVMKPQKKGFLLSFSHYRTIQGIARRFMEYCKSYTGFFNVYRYHNMSSQAKKYLAGLLMKAPRKNLERIDEYVDGVNYESCQHFISDSSWDFEALNKQIGMDVNTLVGSSESVLCIDESAFKKKGKSSAGVARQWNGRLGKVENSQVGVFASLCNSTGGSLIDTRLFLPEEWTNDIERCKKAKIPDSHCTFKTKLDLAFEMINGAISNNINFGWIAADAFYGRDTKLLNKIDDSNMKFVADLPMHHTVYLKDPDPYLPRRKKKIGRKFVHLRSRSEAFKVQTLFEQVTEHQWVPIHVRDTTKGDLKVKAYRQQVYIWNGEDTVARKWWLVMIHDPKANDKTCFLSNAKKNVSLKTLIKRHACRYWIERTFQDGKTSVGMADYQVRGWRAWQHHMSMVMLALLFMLKERIINNKNIELLSCQDIVDLLNYYLPRKDLKEEVVIMNMIKRHKKRKAAIESAYRTQKSTKFIKTK